MSLATWLRRVDATLTARLDQPQPDPVPSTDQTDPAPVVHRWPRRYPSGGCSALAPWEVTLCCRRRLSMLPPADGFTMHASQVTCAGDA